MPSQTLVIPGTEPLFTFDYVFRWPSASIRRKIELIDEKAQAENAETFKKYDDIWQLRDLKGIERTKHFQAHVDLNARAMAFKGELSHAANLTTLRIVKLAISANGLTPEQKNLIALDVTEEFWQEQNIVDAEEAAQRFRNICNGRRPTSSVDTDVADPEHADSDRGSVGGESADATAADAVLVGETAS